MESRKGVSDMQSLKSFRLLGRFMQGMWKYYILAMIATAFNIVLMFLAPQVVRFTVDGVMERDTYALPAVARFLANIEPLHAIALCALAIVLLIIFGGMFSYISRLNIGKGTEGVVEKLRNTLFAHVQKLPFKWHVESQTGDIIQRCTSDVEVVHSFLSTQLVEVVRTLVLIATATVLMFSMNIPLALLAFAFVPIVVLYSALFYKRIAERFHKADVSEGELMVRVQENLTGVRVVKANVPLSEMFGYVGDLRSRTQGRADYSMQFDSYAEVPPSIAKEIIAKARGE